MRHRKCAFCGKLFEDGEEMMPYKTRFVHTSCMEAVAKTIKTEGVKNARKRRIEREKAKKEKAMLSQSASVIPTPVSEEEYAEKQKLYGYIEKITKSKPTGKDYGLISKYRNDYGFTYKGMLNALIYYYEALEKQGDGSTVGIIPYVYDEAQEYMERWEKAKRHNDSITAEEIRRFYTPIKVVIDPTKLNIRRQITDAQPDVFEFRNRRNRTMFDDIDDARAAGLPEPYSNPTPMSEEDKEWIRRFIRGEFNNKR